MDPRKSRGFLNNNPGNVDRSADVWQGEIRDPADPRLTDFQRNELVKGRFAVFCRSAARHPDAGEEPVRLSGSPGTPHGARDHQHLAQLRAP